MGMIHCYKLNLKINASKGTDEEYDEVQTAMKKLHISKKNYRTSKD